MMIDTMKKIIHSFNVQNYEAALMGCFFMLGEKHG